MDIYLNSINSQNKAWINRIYAGDRFSQFVHYNAHWFGQSILCDDLDFRLIYTDSIGPDEPIGLVCYGQSYRDIYMQAARPNTAEIYHVVIHHTYQGKGYGRMTMRSVIEELKQSGRFGTVLVAFHPNNQVAQRVYQSLNFVEVGRNDDNDILLSLNL
jgi:diamine N-acetyltransferase